MRIMEEEIDVLLCLHERSVGEVNMDLHEKKGGDEGKVMATAA